jgi:hypothetical protein
MLGYGRQGEGGTGKGLVVPESEERVCSGGRVGLGRRGLAEDPEDEPPRLDEPISGGSAGGGSGGGSGASGSSTGLSGDGDGGGASSSSSHSGKGTPGGLGGSTPAPQPTQQIRKSCAVSHVYLCRAPNVAHLCIFAEPRPCRLAPHM